MFVHDVCTKMFEILIKKKLQQIIATSSIFSKHLNKHSQLIVYLMNGWHLNKYEKLCFRLDYFV